jgi:AsmA protein
MRAWWRWALGVLAALLVLLGALAGWLVQGFDGERFKRVASDWMRAQHGRELVFDGPVRLQLWPQPAVALKQVRLSERGAPDRPFASIDSASLSLRLQPLLAQRAVEVDRVAARGLKLRWLRGEDGRRNVDDLLDRAAGGGGPGTGGATTIEHLDLADLELQVDDRSTGWQGRLAIGELELGAFGPGLRSPLRLKARAELTEPALDAALELQAGLELRPAPLPGAPPIVHLDKAALRLGGRGFEVEALDAQLQAETIHLEYGRAKAAGDGRAELRDLKLQFSGRRLGWQIDSGRLQLQRLQLGLAERSLDLDSLVLRASGRRDGETLALALDWPMLSVQGDRLQGGPLQGELQLGGGQPLKLQVRSQAPSGRFERITVPGLHVAIDGRRDAGAFQGEAEGTLVLEPRPLAAALEAMTLRLRLDDPALPPLQIVVDGQARLNADAAAGQLAGTLNDQRFDAQIDLRLAGVRPRLDLQARFETLDLNRFTPPARRGAAPAPAPASMPVDLAPLRRADAQLRIRVARLLRAPYRIDGLDLQAGVQGGVLDLRRAAGRAWGGNFQASGSADAGSGRLALRLRAEQMNLQALLADTLGFDGLRGRGRIEADLNSRGATVGALRAGLGGSARVSLEPAALRGVDLAQTLRNWRTVSQSGTDRVGSSAERQTEFSRLAGSFVLRNGVASNQDLDGRSDFLHVGGAGTIDLVQGRLDYRLRARVVNTASGRAGPEMMMLNGVTVPVQLSGAFGGIEWQVNWGEVTAAVAALSVPNVARGTVGTVTRGATGVMRGAAGVLRAIPGVGAASAPR